MLIAPEFAPITFSFGFLEADIEEIAGRLREWDRRRGRGHYKKIRGTFPSILRELEPLSAPWFKRIWIPVSDTPWRTAYFDGFINGGDPFPPISYLPTMLRCRGLTVGSRPDLPNCPGACQMALFGPDKTDWLNYVWSVGAIHDGSRWDWRRSGQDQPFEEPAYYERRKVKDRLPPELVARYCEALGACLDPARFGPGGLLELRHRPAVANREESLAQARKRLGL